MKKVINKIKNLNKLERMVIVAGVLSFILIPQYQDYQEYKKFLKISRECSDKEIVLDSYDTWQETEAEKEACLEKLSVYSDEQLVQWYEKYED